MLDIWCRNATFCLSLTAVARRLENCFGCIWVEILALRTLRVSTREVAGFIRSTYTLNLVRSEKYCRRNQKFERAFPAWFSPILGASTFDFEQKTDKDVTHP